MKDFRLITKRLFGKTFSFIPRSNSRKIILLYHSVGDSLWSISPESFKEQMEWLKSNVHLTNLDSILNFNNEDNKKKNHIEVAVSFDDGYKSLVSNVLPIVKKLKIKPSVFINTSCIKENYSLRSDPNMGHYPCEIFMNWEDVRNLHQEGWIIGSHGCNHYDLTKLDSSVIDKELHLSKNIIEKNLNKSCIHFSYTFGKYNKNLFSKVINSGYKYCYTAIHKPIISGFNRYLIPRINIENVYSLNDFINIINGNWDYHSWKIFDLLKNFSRNIFKVQ